jgi:hypothetical protein
LFLELADGIFLKRQRKKRKMNSRERLLAALNHREPDRVPIDLKAFINDKKGGGSRIINRGCRFSEKEF